MAIKAKTVDLNDVQVRHADIELIIFFFCNLYPLPLRSSSPPCYMLLYPFSALSLTFLQVHPTGFHNPADPHNKVKTLCAEILRGEGGILLDRSKQSISPSSLAPTHVLLLRLLRLFLLLHLVCSSDVSLQLENDSLTSWEPATT